MNSIGGRLFTAYSLLIFMILLTIVVTISLVFSNYLLDNSRRNIDKRLTDIEFLLQEQIHEIVSVCDEVKNNEDVSRLLESYNRDEGWKRAYNNVFNVHGKVLGANYIISRLLLINRNLDILDPIYERVLYREAILNNQGFIDFLQGNYFYHFSSPGIFPIDIEEDSAQDDLTVVLYQKLLDDNFWLMGYLLAVLRKEALFDSLWANNQDGLFEGISVFSSSNKLVHQEGLGFDASAINIDFSKVEQDQWFDLEMVNLEQKTGQFMVFIKPVSGVNWYLTGVVPYSKIFEERNNIIKYIVIIGIIFIIIAFSVSFFLAGTITRPLFSITKAMHAYDESLILEPINVQAEGELEYLVKVYNRLVSNINRYIANIYEEQEKKKEAELISLQYELDFLQAQINPHFIHNTLNAIGHQAEKAGNTEIFESLKSFNILLRASISGTEDLIELSEELELVGNFINILQLRYGSRFSIDMDIETDLEEMMVPKLILQPLVENSIFHGIEPTGKKGKIEIKAFRINNTVEISVKDDGMGIASGEVSSILENSNKARQFNRIGLKNVDDRIKILFGKEYGLKIKSKEGSGTIVSINIPL
jgi:two-component system sensor histidine kinase YesM